MRISDWSSDVCSSDLIDLSLKRRKDAIERDVAVDLGEVHAGLREEVMGGEEAGDVDFGRHRMAGEIVGQIDRENAVRPAVDGVDGILRDTVDQRDRSEEHTSELQSLMRISYAVFCLKKKTNTLTIFSSQNINKNIV